MSDQNTAPEPPQAPRQTAGSAPGGSETIGSAPGGSETIGSAPPPEPEQPEPAPPQPGPPQPVPARKSPLPRILLTAAIAVVVVVGAAFGAAFWFLRGAGSSPEVGSCFSEAAVTEPGTDGQTVDCTDPSARYRVVGILDDQRAEQLKPDQNCTDWETSVAAIWLGREGGNGKIYCVEELQPS